MRPIPPRHPSPADAPRHEDHAPGRRTGITKQAGPHPDAPARRQGPCPTRTRESVRVAAGKLARSEPPEIGRARAQIPRRLAVRNAASPRGMAARFRWMRYWLSVVRPRRHPLSAPAQDPAAARGMHGPGQTPEAGRPTASPRCRDHAYGPGRAGRAGRVGAPVQARQVLDEHVPVTPARWFAAVPAADRSQLPLWLPRTLAGVTRPAAGQAGEGQRAPVPGWGRWGQGLRGVTGLGESSPDSLECPAIAGGRGGEQALAEYVVVVRRAERSAWSPAPVRIVNHFRPSAGPTSRRDRRAGAG